MKFAWPTLRAKVVSFSRGHILSLPRKCCFAWLEVNLAYLGIGDRREIGNQRKT